MDITFDRASHFIAALRHFPLFGCLDLGRLSKQRGKVENLNSHQCASADLFERRIDAILSIQEKLVRNILPFKIRANFDLQCTHIGSNLVAKSSPLGRNLEKMGDQCCISGWHLIEDLFIYFPLFTDIQKLTSTNANAQHIGLLALEPDTDINYAYTKTK